MSTRITRAGKAAAFTHNEMDTNLKKVAQTKATAYTIAESDNWDTIEYSGAGTESFTLPDAATVVAAADTGDFEVTVKHVGTGTLTIARTTGADTIDGTAADITLETNAWVTLKVIQAGTGYNIVSGNYTGIILTTPNLGTPSAGVLTNCTGTAAGLTAGTVTTNANLTGPITSVGNATSITAASVDQTAIGPSAVGRGELKTTTATSVSGTLAAASSVNAPLTRDCFFPNIYVQASGQQDVHVTGHSTDGTSGDSPRLGLANINVSNSYSYAIDYRYVQA